MLLPDGRANFAKRPLVRLESCRLRFSRAFANDEDGLPMAPYFLAVDGGAVGEGAPMRKGLYSWLVRRSSHDLSNGL